MVVQTQLPPPVNAQNQEFFKAFGARITLTRNDREVTLSLDELMGTSLPKRRGQRGPISRLQLHIEAVGQLPKTKQQFVSTVLAQAGH